MTLVGWARRFLIHVTETGERDAFIWAKQERYVPQGVKDIDEKAMKSAPRRRDKPSTLSARKAQPGEAEWT